MRCFGLLLASRELVSPQCWLAFTMAAISVAGDARAQCGAKSTTCSDCHDGVRAPVPVIAAWHADHAFASLCPSCHGGRGDVADAALAHAGMVLPLSLAACGACHGERGAALIEGYRARQGTSADADAGAGVAAPRSLAPQHGEPGPNRVAAALALALAVGGLAFVARRERARRLESTEDLG